MTKSTLSGQLYAQSMLMFVLFGVASLFTVVKFLPTDALATSLPFMQVSGLSHVLLELALLSGVIATGISFLRDELDTLTLWTYRAWTVFLVLATFAGGFGLFSGQYWLELPFLFDVALIIWILVSVILPFQQIQTFLIAFQGSDCIHCLFLW